MNEPTMALTDFKFNVIQKKMVLLKHGCIPKELLVYKESSLGGYLEEECYESYWSHEAINSLEVDIKHTFSIIDSWGNTRVYGFEDEIKIEVDDEDVFVKFSALNLNYKLIKELFDLLEKYECLFVICESGMVLEVSFQAFLSELYTSRAHRFVNNPKTVLDEIKKENTKH